MPNALKVVQSPKYRPIWSHCTLPTSQYLMLEECFLYSHTPTLGAFTGSAMLMDPHPQPTATATKNVRAPFATDCDHNLTNINVIDDISEFFVYLFALRDYRVTFLATLFRLWNELLFCIISWPVSLVCIILKNYIVTLIMYILNQTVD